MKAALKTAATISYINKPKPRGAVIPRRKEVIKMKLKELKTILYSSRDNVQFAVIYDSKTNVDIAEGAIDNIVSDHGEKEVIRIEAYKNALIITV